MPDDLNDSEASGAEQRLLWFMNQRNRVTTVKDPNKDVEDELPPEVPVDPGALPTDAPPPLSDLMREYRQRLQDAADGG